MVIVPSFTVGQEVAVATAVPVRAAPAVIVMLVTVPWQPVLLSWN